MTQLFERSPEDRALSHTAVECIQRLVDRGTGQPVRLCIGDSARSLSDIDSELLWRLWVLGLAPKFARETLRHLYALDGASLPFELAKWARRTVPPFSEGSCAETVSLIEWEDTQPWKPIALARPVVWMETNDPMLIAAALSLGARAMGDGWTEADVHRAVALSAPAPLDSAIERVWSSLRQLNEPVLVEERQLHDFIRKRVASEAWDDLANLWTGFALDGAVSVQEFCIVAISDVVTSGRIGSGPDSIAGTFASLWDGVDVLRQVQERIVDLGDVSASKAFYDWLLPPDAVAGLLQRRDLFSTNHGADEYWAQMGIPDAEVDARAMSSLDQLPMLDALRLLAEQGGDVVRSAQRVLAAEVISLDEQMLDSLESSERYAAGAEMVRIVGSRRWSDLMVAMEPVGDWERVLSFDEVDDVTETDEDEDP